MTLLCTTTGLSYAAAYQLVDELTTSFGNTDLEKPICVRANFFSQLYSPCSSKSQPSRTQLRKLHFLNVLSQSILLLIHLYGAP